MRFYRLAPDRLSAINRKLLRNLFRLRGRESEFPACMRERVANNANSFKVILCFWTIDTKLESAGYGTIEHFDYLSLVGYFLWGGCV
jgi:hypothetical protein